MRKKSIFYSFIYLILSFVFICVYLDQARISVLANDEYYEDDASTPNINAEEVTAADAYEYEYEDDGTNVVSASVTVDGSSTASEELPPIQNEPLNYGFYRNPGGGLVKIQKLLVDEEFLNNTVEYYECLKRSEIQKPIVEANDTDADMHFSLEEQVATMKSKLEKALKQVNQKAGGGTPEESQSEGENTETDQAAQNATATEEPTKKKRMSFREKQALRQEEARKKEIEREIIIPKFRLGADCESLVCGSCKALVEEFANNVQKAAPNPDIKYIDQLTEGFCAQRQLGLKYGEIVIDICKIMDRDELGYKEALIRPFEQQESWEKTNAIENIREHQKKVCVEIGACAAEEFIFVDKPVSKTQEQWNSSCFVCQAFAKDLEERVHLARHITESSIVPMVSETCDRLHLPAEYRPVCKPLTEGKLLDDIAWLTKVHEESIRKKAKGEQRFMDKLCEEIDWCHPWMDPDKIKEKEVRASLEPVFF